MIGSLAIFNNADSINVGTKPNYNENIDGVFILVFKEKSLLVGSYESDDGVIAIPKGSSYQFKFIKKSDIKFGEKKL